MYTKNKRSFGAEGEKIAVQYLQKNGYEIIERNFIAGRIGEIDIITRENGYICFVEVKTRTSIAFGMPSEAVDFKKQQKIRKVANIYISTNKLYDCDVRFDVVEIFVENDEKYRVNIIKNAF